MLYEVGHHAKPVRPSRVRRAGPCRRNRGERVRRENKYVKTGTRQRDMRVFYYLSHYISHRLAGLAYIDVLRGLGHEVRANLPPAFDAASPVAAETAPSDGLSREQAAFLEKADIVILHQEPTLYASIYEDMPVLTRKYVIAYAVWENEKLTPFFISPLQTVNEVWTCSEFCRAAMAPHVKHCFVLPH
ncbi:MAG: hypothetical protein LBB66_10455, partial [Desulfovibrio sp.]|nr:hypothetical protein [Desulfovibrio sp.]